MKMIVVKVFWETPYLTELEAKVVYVDNAKIMLDRTILFAKSGEQDFDSGTIGDYEIVS